MHPTSTAAPEASSRAPDEKHLHVDDQQPAHEAEVQADVLSEVALDRLELLVPDVDKPVRLCHVALGLLRRSVSVRRKIRRRTRSVLVRQQTALVGLEASGTPIAYNSCVYVMSTSSGTGLRYANAVLLSVFFRFVFVCFCFFFWGGWQVAPILSRK